VPVEARHRNAARRALRLLAVAIAVAALGTGSARAEGPPLVAAASDLNFALTEIAAGFERDTRERVELVFGSSGTLVRQIRDGAPFELFLSADEAFVEQLSRDGLTRDRGALYAVGRIVLFAPAGSPLHVRDGLDGLRRLLAEGKVTRFAIANPEHAPYGRAAEAALRKHGLWESLRPRLVLGENVSQAAQFAATSNAVGGIIAHSLALAPALSARGESVLIPETDHPPLRQRMVLLTRATPAAERFYRYLQQPEARATLKRHGFGLPE
jgi:molybdate transport system substrate-binding protein